MKYLILLLSLMISIQSDAQKSTNLTPSQYGNILTIERKMQRLGAQLLGDTSQAKRVQGAKEFIKTLVEALKVENSFQYKFDSIPYLAKVIPEDSSFKIYTFQVMLDNYTFVHFGALQLNRKSLKLIPFKDCSDTFPITPQRVLTNKNWLGAVYYKSFQKVIQGKPVYFLFGYDQNDIISDKKYIEPMTIVGDSMVKFGIPLFDKNFPRIEVENNKFMAEKKKIVIQEKKTVTYYRYVLEYRKRGTVALRYDKAKDVIIHDHIVPIDSKSTEVGFMKLPDGTYEGLKWDKTLNKYIWNEEYKLTDVENNLPIRPAPIKDKKPGYKQE